MTFGRLLAWGGLLIVGGVLAGAGLIYALRAPVTARTEIYNGVFLTVEDVPAGPLGSGRAMIVEVKWDTPGVRLVNRPFTYPFESGDPKAWHYRLEMADWALLRDNASILVNTTLYSPSNLLQALPGMPVRSYETVVVDGKVSHVDKNSYLMYWDKQMQAHLLFTKPPDPESLAEAVLGFGVQGVQIYDGHARYNAIDGKSDLQSRTFIGFNEAKKTLYLLAFERASAYEMIERALKAGVTFGGQVDTRHATDLLVGAGASHVLPHTGIREWRPLGPYLEVFADPVKD